MWASFQLRRSVETCTTGCDNFFAIEYAGHTEHRDKGAFTNIFRRGLGGMKGKIGASKFWEKKAEAAGENSQLQENRNDSAG